MDYAVIETGGKQYKVRPGDTIEVDRITQDGDVITFANCLLTVTDGEVSIGRPYLDRVSVIGKILANEKGKKIRVARFTAKSRHRRVIGFRPLISRVQIEKISTSTVSGENIKKVSAKKAAEKAKAKK